MKKNSVSVKEINKKNILKIILNKNSISRISISKLLKISRPTVSAYVNELIEEGLVKEVGKSASTAIGGKRAVLVEFNNEASYIIGVLLEVENITIGLTDLRSNIIEKITFPTEEYLGPDNIIEKLIKGLKKIIKKSNVEKKKIIGIGVAATGLVDRNKGIIIFSPNLTSWKNIKLREIIELELNLPVFVENECRVKAVAEKIFGLAKNIKNFVCIQTGIGIGSGVFINDKLLVGKKGMAGEFGHFVIDANSELVCHCGNKGCIESFCSTTYLINSIKTDLNKGFKSSLNLDEEITIEKLVELFNKKDETIEKNVIYNAKILGIAISNAIKTFNPDIVIIHGPMIKFGNKYLQSVNESVNTHTFPMINDKYNIKFSELDENIGILGTTAIMFEEKFNLNDFNLFDEYMIKD